MFFRRPRFFWPSFLASSPISSETSGRHSRCTPPPIDATPPSATSPSSSPPPPRHLNLPTAPAITFMSLLPPHCRAPYHQPLSSKP
ncbi:hypothetical protein Tco_1011308 [Tanacetum coccineum]